MNPDLATLIRKYNLPDDVISDFEQVWKSRSRSLLATVVGYNSVHLEPDEDPVPEPREISERYRDLGPLGEGGMGEVRRVRDLELNRTLAMKIIHPGSLRHPAAVARFLEEAQASAQLQHPNIVPVHDLGQFPDGRLWFTMREVRGRTLGAAIAEVHAASSERWETGASGWTFRRVITAFHAVCNAVAYAHERGVVHRDLKPDNTMVGDRGEVYVLDWGLAKVLGRPDRAAEAGELDAVRTDRSENPDYRTRVGQVAGTPAYMPPEQAHGDIEQIDARSDVYALGAMLYEILSGRPPYEGHAQAVLVQVLAGPPAPVGRGTPAKTFGFDIEETPTGPSLPLELVAACERAMARKPEDRFPTATALAEEIQAWLDGARRREQGLVLVKKAQIADREATLIAAEAASRRAQAEQALKGVEPWRPEEDKLLGWELEDQAVGLEREVERLRYAARNTLLGALQIAPDLTEAHAELAVRYQRRHHQYEEARVITDKDITEPQILAHCSALPLTHPIRQQVTAYLKGDGALTLTTDPPGAEVLLFRYERHHRRLVEVFDRSLGKTPLRAISIAMGSYLCRIQHPNCEEVRYPVEITRQHHWDGIPPGSATPYPIALPRRGMLGQDEVYVPAGWFQAGGTEGLQPFTPMRLWCDPFVIQRYPVTNAEYLEFLNDLVAQGRESEALEHVPRERSATEHQNGELLYRLNDQRFTLRANADADGDLWLPDHPVVMVNWFSANAFLDWKAKPSAPWRLPHELEWEKAARGVDGRIFPWGNWFDASWCLTTSSRPRRSLVGSVHEFPVDVSPYGVGGCAGNVRDWCINLHDISPTPNGRVEWDPSVRSAVGGRASRGGAWIGPAHTARLDVRPTRTLASLRQSAYGFRGAYSWR